MQTFGLSPEGQNNFPRNIKLTAHTGIWGVLPHYVPGHMYSTLRVSAPRIEII